MLGVPDLGSAYSLSLAMHIYICIHVFVYVRHVAGSFGARRLASYCLFNMGPTKQSVPCRYGSRGQ